MTPLRWSCTMAGMVLGYIAAGPAGGFAGLIAGWWLGRTRPKCRLQALSKTDAQLIQAYGTLGLKPGANADAVRTAYRKRMNLYHPDKLANGATEAELRAAQQSAHETRKAYETLREHEKASSNE